MAETTTAASAARSFKVILPPEAPHHSPICGCGAGATVGEMKPR